jgi:hypothetical protein
MNRALLLIVCDFLLISLLALARFDSPKDDILASESESVELQDNVDKDLIDVLKYSLETENNESRREIEELETDKDALEGLLRETQDDLKEREEVATRLELEKEDITQRYKEKNEQLITTDRERVALLENLSITREQAGANKERAKLLQEQLQSREQDLAQQERELQAAVMARINIEREKQKVITDLKIQETENKLLEQNLIAAKAEIDTVRVEKDVIQQQATKLAEGVTNLTEQSTLIQEEIRQLQPRSLNSIVNEFKANRVHISFNAESRGIIGLRSRRYDAKSILISDGKNVYALLHTHDTPFRLSDEGEGLANVTGSLNVGDKQMSILQVGFLTADPRLLVVAVSTQVGEQLGIHPFSLSEEPLKYPEAVLIGSDEGYYGETDFKLDHRDDRFLMMQSKLFNRLFGEFSPSRSDLVFAKTGSFMGLMINKQYCALVDNFNVDQKFIIGINYNSEQSEAVVSRQYKRLLNLSLDLQ